MMNVEFWKWFEEVAAPKLGIREVSFRKLFKRLDLIEHSLLIVETGTIRVAERWVEGQSTVLFDRYVRGRPGSMVHTIDADSNTGRICVECGISNSVVRHVGDSIMTLRSLVRSFIKDEKSIDLLYLDALDVDMANIGPSARHHLYELMAALPAMTDETLVVVDDSPTEAWIIPRDDGTCAVQSRFSVSGKGKYVADFAERARATQIFRHYQVGWVGISSCAARCAEPTELRSSRPNVLLNAKEVA